MRIVYRAATIIDAELVKTALEEAGIPAFVGGAYLTGAVGELPCNDLVTVMVPETGFAQASRIAQAIDAGLAECRLAPDAIDAVPHAVG